jgi:hypothetical protein
LAILAIVLLVAASPASGSQGVAAMQFRKGSTEVQDLHSSQMLNSVRVSVGTLRGRMHNTWLFFYVFVAAWTIVLVWGLIEGKRLNLEVGRPEVHWMGWMSLSVISTAILYGMGTNGILARRYPRSVGISDALAIGFVLALPVFAWGRLHRKREEELEGEDPAVLHRRMFTTLQLDRGDSYPPAPVPLSGSAIREPKMDIVAQAFEVTPRVMTMVTMDGVIEPAGVPEFRRPSLMQENIPEQVKEGAPMSFEPASVQPAPVLSVPPQSAPARSASHGAPAFRDQLRVLNESWARIEQSGKEIEQWFDQQRQQAIAHLERHPGVRGAEAQAELSRNFLNEKLAAVDAEWAAIRKAALEISQWFGDAPATKS